VAELADLLHQRVLTLDIERIPGLAPVWDQKTRWIGAQTWRRLPRTICVGYHWYDKRHPALIAEWDDTNRVNFVNAAWELLDQADVIVTFNGKRFDLPHLKGMFAEAGMPPPSPWRNVDLFQVARTAFGFESKSLDHLCQRLGVVGKRGRYDAAQAEAAASGDERAQAALTRYCKADVKATVAVYDALRAWIPNHPHIGHTSSETLTCPNCGGTDLEPNGSYRAITMEYAQYRCRHCKANVRAGHVRRVARTRGVRDV
jgi:hypothetical protein